MLPDTLLRKLFNISYLVAYQASEVEFQVQVASFHPLASFYEMKKFNKKKKTKKKTINRINHKNLAITKH